MMDVVFGLLILFFVFFLIGVGPSIFFFNKKSSFEKFIIFSPVLGYVFTLLIGVYATLLNFSVDDWAISYSILACSFSLIVWKYSHRRVNIKGLFIFYLYGLVFLLLVLPMLLGGLNYTIFRGNGTDSFNYMTMANFLQHEHWNLLKTASFQDLLDKHASYPFAKFLLTERWATSLMLAYFSSLVKMPIYRVEYAYTLLFFLMSTGVFYLFIKKIINEKLWIILGLAVVCSTGFWSQLVLDTRAMSHMSVLPILLTFFYLFINLRNGRFPIFFLMGMFGASIVYLYPEMIPLVVLSLGFYVFYDVFLQRGLKVILKPLMIILLVSFTFLLPSLKFLLAFFEKQLHLAVGNKITWHLAYFSWLYDFPLMGFWGEGPYTKFHVLIVLGTIFSFLISIVFIYTLTLSFFKTKNRYLVLSVCTSWASLIMFIILYMKGQYWAAGKSLSFAFPFFIFTFLGGVQLLQKTSLEKASNSILYLWIISQLILAVLRIFLVINHHDFPHYINGHGYYRQHDLNDKPFKNIQCQGIVIDLNDGWLEEYFNFVFSWKFPVFNVNGVHDRNHQIIGLQNKHGNYDCKLRLIDKRISNKRIITKNKEFELTTVDEMND